MSPMRAAWPSLGVVVSADQVAGEELIQEEGRGDEEHEREYKRELHDG
jgi:hypothetical protein